MIIRKTKIHSSFGAKRPFFILHLKTILHSSVFIFISSVSYTLEENALLQYNDKQVIATVKGVDDNFFETTGLDSMLVRGDALLYNGKVSCAIMGAGVSYSMGVICDYIEPLMVSVPSRTAEIKGNFSDAASDLLNSISLYPSGIFAIQQVYDMRYVVMPINEVRRLLEFNDEVGAAEIKFKKGTMPDEAVKQLYAKLGDKFKVLDRNKQHEYAYKIMQSEKWAIFMILIFILLIASFNIIASITMLIIDKRNDISILRSMGADDSAIRRIFFIEGLGISIVGAVIGLFVGGIICWLQMSYGFVKLGDGTGSFIIDAYPVSIHIIDILWSFVAVMLIGLFAAWIPVRFVTKRLKENN